MILEETPVQRDEKNPRASAIALQECMAHARKAERFIAQEKFDEAEREFIQALTAKPGALDIEAELAKLYLMSGKEQKAEALYKELLQKSDNVSLYSNAALAMYKQGKFADACVYYKEALDRDTQNPERFSTMGKSCIAANRFEEAVPYLEHAVERLPRDTELLRCLAECYEFLQEKQDALEVYAKINKIEPYNEEVKKKLQSLAA